MTILDDQYLISCCSKKREQKRQREEIIKKYTVRNFARNVEYEFLN